MVNVYVDLVLNGIRALEPNDKGIPLVPTIYRAKVKAEIERMIAAGEI